MDRLLILGILRLPFGAQPFIDRMARP